MKIKSLLLTLTLTLFMLASFGQNKATVYKADKWLDTKGKGGWAKAYKDPTKEKAEIIIGDQFIKVTLGTKTFNYKIVSSNRFSDVQMRYSVTLNGEDFTINVSEHSAGKYSINIDGEWMVQPITDVSTINKNN